MNKQKKVIMVAAIAAAVIFVIFFAKKNTAVSLPAKEESKPEPDPFYLNYNQPPIAGVTVGGATVYGGTTTVGGINVEGSPTYNDFAYNYLSLPSDVQPPPPATNQCGSSNPGGFTPAAMTFNTSRAMRTLPDYVSEYVSPPDFKSLDMPPAPPKPVYRCDCDIPIGPDNCSNSKLIQNTTCFGRSILG